MLLTKNGLTGWVLANVVASAVFVHLASWTWLEPNLRGEDAARGGDALAWAVSALPALAIAGFVNAIWFGLASLERRRNGGAWPVHSITVVAAVWISALVVDHFRGLGF